MKMTQWPRGAAGLMYVCGLALGWPAMVRADHAAGAGAAVPPPTVEVAPIRASLALLASDLYEGRGTGQRGADLTVAYLEAQAMALGLLPGNGSSYRQEVRLAGVQAVPERSTLQLSVAGKPLALNFGEDWIWWHGDSKERHQFDVPLLFVGYGIDAPEERWNDYKDTDCHGKLLVMMVNEPPPSAEEPDRFEGRSMTYYGRWAYKFEEARRRGAAGVLLIHTDASAGYGWSVVKNSGIAERFQLQSEPDSGTALQGWLSDASAGRLFAAVGADLDALRNSAGRRDFQPLLLNARLSGETRSEVRHIVQYNIAAVVTGTDPQLKRQTVVYTAHWDHLGKQGEQIYNGAVDNASGTAALLAMAKAAVAQPARRSQMFLWVAAEEKGLLGSKAYVNKPLWPLQNTVANLNLDVMNFVGPTRDINVAGSERAGLAALASQAAASLQMVPAKDLPDTTGGYFRSDHFSFAQAGVPAISVTPGFQFQSEQEASLASLRSYLQRYHQTSDRYDPDWNLSGMQQQAQFTLTLGYLLANQDGVPVWRANDRFGQLRAASMKQTDPRQP